MRCMASAEVGEPSLACAAQGANRCLTLSVRLARLACQVMLGGGRIRAGVADCTSSRQDVKGGSMGRLPHIKHCWQEQDSTLTLTQQTTAQSDTTALVGACHAVVNAI